jgi:chitodextrinase
LINEIADLAAHDCVRAKVGSRAFGFVPLFVALIGLISSTPAAAAIAYVQGTSTTPAGSVSSATATFSGAQGAGNLNVVAIGFSTGTLSVQSVSDSRGNTYTLAVGPTTNSAKHAIYYAKNIVSASANANTITVTLSGASSFVDLRIAEYSGLDTVSPLDVVKVGTGTSATSDSGSMTTTNANDLLVAANYTGKQTSGPGSGYTQRLLSGESNILEDRTTTTTGSYSATAPLSQSTFWIMQLVAFKAASVGGGDTSPPTVPTSVTATAVSATQINLSWAASTDNVAVTGYEVQRCQGASCTSFAAVGTPTGASFNDTGLTPGTTYRYQVRARDAVPNWSATSSIVSATTSADSAAPSVPSGLTATVISSSQINLSWTASTDNVAVTGYEVQRCQGASCTTFAAVGTPTGTTFNDTGRTPGTTYRYQVRARDAIPNWSATSSIVSATTSADTTAPSVPSGLTATVISGTQINLSWTASTDNVGVTGYRVERCQGASCSSFAQVGTPTGATFNDMGLTASMSYSYRVRAADAVPNLSGYSSTVSATTSAATSGTAGSVTYQYDSFGRLKQVTVAPQ